MVEWTVAAAHHIRNLLEIEELVLEFLFLSWLLWLMSRIILFLAEPIRVLGILLIFLLFLTSFLISLTIRLHWRLFFLLLCISFLHPVVILMFTS